MENLGTDYLKYHFVELFEKSFRHSATYIKLYAAEVYDPRSEWNRPLLMMIDMSINKDNEQRAEEANIKPTTSKDQQEVEQSDNIPTEMMINYFCGLITMSPSICQ